MKVNCRTSRLFLGLMMVPVLMIRVQAGTISGYIQDDLTGTPVTQLDMNLYDPNWTYLTNDTATGGTGTYTFYNVPAGSYYVKANPKWPHHYLAEYWDNSLTRDNATLVQVGEGQDVTGIDFSLAAGYYIGGKVLDVNATGIANIDFNVYNSNWEKADVDASSDLGGRYFIGGLPGGDYYVMANPEYAQPFLDQYYDHANGPIHATLVTISPPDDNIGINFDLLEGAYIEGDIISASTQQPIPGISVKVYNESGEKMRLEGRSRDTGHYTAGAFKAGQYFLRADPSYPDGVLDQYYPDAYQFSDALPVTISPPKPTSGIDFKLPQGSYIRGSIKTETNLPIPDIKVKFYNDEWDVFELANSKSKSDGTFLSGALPAGNIYAYAVAVYPQPFIDEYYNDVVEKEDAEPILITIGQETSNIDFVLAPGGYISGTVRDDVTGLTVYDMDIDLYDASWLWVDYSDHTDSDGFYLVGALPFGNYYVRCDPNASQGHIPEFYDDAFWMQDAVLVSVTEDHNAESIDISLAAGGKITGRVRDQDSGNPVDDVSIEIYTQTQALLPVRIVQTKTDGIYLSHGIPSGSYYIKSVPETGSGYTGEFYDNAENFDQAIPVSVTSSQTTNGIDFELKYTAQPTPTPPISLGVDLEMPSTYLTPGDVCYLKARIGNPGSNLGELPLFVMLDLYSQYYCWPSWRLYDPPEVTDYDYSLLEIQSGAMEIPILAPFEWPDTGQTTISGIYFYGAILSSDFSHLIGTMDAIAFGFGPG